MLEFFAAFIAVAEARSFSAVARAEGVAVSSVSRRIELLEREVGAKLFSRSSRRLTLTEAGERLLPHAKRIVVDIEDVRDEIRELEEMPRGRLVVTAPSGFGRQHVMPAVLRFMERYPHVEVEMHLSDALVDLSLRRTDVAIRMGSLTDSDLLATRLAPMRRLACASPAYLERYGTPKTPADLIDHNCLTVASSPIPSGWWRFAGTDVGALRNVSGTFRSDDTDALLQAALAGLGVVHLASWLVGDMVRNGRLRVLFTDARQPRSASAGIYAVRLPVRQGSIKTRLLVSHLKETFGSPPYWDR